MKSNKLTKILIKISENSTSKWTHLCYVPENLYGSYKMQFSDRLLNLNETLSRWAKEDFDVDLAVIETEELETLKSLVREHYKQAYPDVYLEQTTDRQGWLRVWVIKKMKEDLGINGE